MKPYERDDIKFDLFLSHSAKDREFVAELAGDLAKAGLRIWLDEWNITPGASFAEAIEDALKTSRFIVIVMSPDYFQSAWTQQEWHYSLAREMEDGAVRVIPLLYRDCEIPPLLRTKQWADFRDRGQYPIAVDRLARQLRQLSSIETAAAPRVDVPTIGQRTEELDPATISDLRALLRDAVEALRDRPEAQARTAATGSTVVEEDLCFVVMPFAVESLNIVYDEFIKPTLEDRCHIRPQRGDDVFGSNVVMDDITKSIRKARLIIADLTGRNPNVFYEVGIAHALNKEVSLMTQSIDDVPFDLRHRRALVYEYSPRGCKKLERDLYENIKSMITS